LACEEYCYPTISGKSTKPILRGTQEASENKCRKPPMTLKNIQKAAYDMYKYNAHLGGFSESIATLPPFGPIEGQKWFDQISSQ
jgi:hypothetical protein